MASAACFGTILGAILLAYIVRFDGDQYYDAGDEYAVCSVRVHSAAAPAAGPSTPSHTVQVERPLALPTRAATRAAARAPSAVRASECVRATVARTASARASLVYGCARRWHRGARTTGKVTLSVCRSMVHQIDLRNMP
eukprot:COSAG02_NODE_7820_length_2834_cov_2.576600_4_plen_139_part_00